MEFAVGDRVLAGGLPCEVEAKYTSGGVTRYVAVRSDGTRQVWEQGDVRAVPPPEDPVRRKAVDLILERTSVPRGDLFEYPYNEHESRRRINKAEHLLDDLLVVLGK